MVLRKWTFLGADERGDIPSRTGRCRGRGTSLARSDCLLEVLESFERRLFLAGLCRCAWAPSCGSWSTGRPDPAELELARTLAPVAHHTGASGSLRCAEPFWDVSDARDGDFCCAGREAIVSGARPRRVIICLRPAGVPEFLAQRRALLQVTKQPCWPSSISPIYPAWVLQGVLEARPDSIADRARLRLLVR